MAVVKTMDHTQYQKDLRKKDSDAVLFILNDAKQALEAMPDGPNAGYYADEVCYCGMELTRRKDGVARQYQQRNTERNWIGASGVDG